MDHQSISDKTDTNPNPRPSSLRTNSTKRPMFGCKGKSLSFEDKICTVIPNDSVFLQTESDHEDEDRMCFSSFDSRWWEPDGDRNWVQYCMNTSIHGLKYLAESKRHICERLFWVLAFGISCLTASHLINSGITQIYMFILMQFQSLTSQLNNSMAQVQSKSGGYHISTIRNFCRSKCSIKSLNNYKKYVMNLALSSRLYTSYLHTWVVR